MTSVKGSTEPSGAVTATVWALAGFAVVLVGLFLLRQQQQSLTAEMTKRGLTIAENFAASAKTPLLTNDELTLAVLVKDAMKDPDVAYAIVADSEGKTLAQSDPSPTEGPISSCSTPKRRAISDVSPRSRSSTRYMSLVVGDRHASISL